MVTAKWLNQNKNNKKNLTWMITYTHLCIKYCSFTTYTTHYDQQNCLVVVMISASQLISVSSKSLTYLMGS